MEEQKMLINKLQDPGLEMADGMVPEEPVTLAATHRTAANASQFVSNDMQARRHRRQRRMERTGGLRISAWSVRTW
jgi:hypothetical protein